MTIAVGCVIIAVLSYLISISGFALIHTFEKYSWIMSFVLLLVLLGQVGGKVDTSIPAPTSGLDFSGAMLSFIALCFSSSSGWCSIASDYYCNYPAKTPSWKIFSLTLVGVTIPTVFTTLVGVCLGSITTLQTDPSTAYLTEAYEDHGLGGLLRESYHPLGFSKFCLILLVFTVLGNNIAINYSSGLSLQLLGHYFHAVPRFIWSFLNALVIAVLAIAGREHLSTIVSNFVSLLGYWTVSFTFILLIEDKIYRQRNGYNLSVWNTPSKLPMGIAAVLALIVGYCAGGVTGMSQTWYVGPIARKFSAYGGDVGVYLSAVFTIIVYLPARYFERKMTAR
jgi:purine-cytosine permease-like protein